MSSLAELQHAFTHALADWQAASPAGVIAHTGVTKARFDAYRRNVQASLIGVLEARFPVVARLTGTEFFRAMSQAYLRIEPPRSAVLLAYGGGFAGFVAGFSPAADLPYLADVARLEWLQHEAYHAADAAPLTAAALAAIAPEALAATTLTLHPSLRLLATPFPVLAIWQTNTHDAVVQVVDLAAGADALLIARPHLDVEIRRLPTAALPFIADLAAGLGLGEAAECAASRADHLDLQRALASVISAGCIAGYR